MARKLLIFSFSGASFAVRTASVDNIIPTEIDDFLQHFVLSYLDSGRILTLGRAIITMYTTVINLWLNYIFIKEDMYNQSWLGGGILYLFETVDDNVLALPSIGFEFEISRVHDWWFWTELIKIKI